MHNTTRSINIISITKYILCTFFIISTFLYYVDEIFANDICGTYEDILNSKTGDGPIPYNNKNFDCLVEYYSIEFDNYGIKKNNLYYNIGSDIKRCFSDKYSLKSGWLWNNTTLGPEDIIKYIELNYINNKYSTDSVKEDKLCSLLKSVALNGKTDLNIEDFNTMYSIYGNNISDTAYMRKIKPIIEKSLHLKGDICFSDIGFVRSRNSNIYRREGEMINDPVNLIIEKLEYGYDASIKRKEEEQNEERIKKEKEIERQKNEKEIERQKIEKRNKICKKIVKEYDLTEEESTFLVPSGETFGEFLCNAKLAGVVVDFSKHGFLTKEYNLVISNDDDNTTGKFNFFKPKDQDFIDDGKKYLKTDKVILNYTIEEPKKIYKPMTFSEAAAILSLCSSAFKVKSMMREALLLGTF